MKNQNLVNNLKAPFFEWSFIYLFIYKKKAFEKALNPPKPFDSTPW